MSDKISKNIHFLLLLASSDTSRHQKESLLESISKPQLASICEIALNVLQGSLPVPSDRKPTLIRHLTSARVLASKKSTLSDRKEALKVPVIEVLLLTALPFLQHMLHK